MAETLVTDTPPVRRAPARIAVEEQQGFFREMLDNWLRLKEEPYRGVTTNGTPDASLFKLRDTGLSTAPTMTAARAFLASLDADQQKTARFDLDDRAWRQWSNIHRNVMRHGICLDRLTDTQRQRALEIVRSSVSAETFGEVINTMRLNEHTSELTGKLNDYGEWFYYISIFGEPSETEPWGWQMDGHHININCFVVGGQMVLTPMLLGAEPVTALFGKYKGATILRREEAAGWQLMKSLSAAQQEEARIG